MNTQKLYALCIIRAVGEHNHQGGGHLWSRVAILCAAVAMMALCPGRTLAQNLETPPNANYQNGSYGNQNDRIVFACIVVRGPFTVQNINSTIQQYCQDIQSWQNNLKTLNTGQPQIFHTFPGDTCLLYIWVNVDKGLMGWIAMVNTSQNTAAIMTDSRQQPWTATGMHGTDWSTEGWQIHIQGGADGNGNIVMSASVRS